MTTEARIRENRNELIKVIVDDPTVDYTKIEKMTDGLITKDAKEGNGLDMAKWLYRHYTDLLGGEEKVAAAPKRRGRKPGSKNKPKAKAKTEPKAKPAKKKAQAKAGPAPAKKKRGRPKGSKNKPKTETPPTE